VVLWPKSTKFAKKVKILMKTHHVINFSLDTLSNNFLAIFAKIRVHLYRKSIISVHKVICIKCTSESEYKEKHGVWGPMPELTITSFDAHSRVDSNTFTMGNPMPESILTLCQSRLYPPVRDLGFGLWRIPTDRHS
jgi:hypothetical protein